MSGEKEALQDLRDDTSEQVLQVSRDDPFEQIYDALEKKIGSGSYGDVFCARHLDSGDEFAVKIIDRSKLKNEENVFREVGVLRELSCHPNIVTLLDFFASPGFFHVVLELARGGDLFGRIAKRKFYTENDARCLAKEILSAISYIHSKEYVHRDLKPENLLLVDTVNDANVTKVADFGFAKKISGAGLLTRCGTPSYVAPEVVVGVRYKKAVDVWSCGVILYLLLGGYLPFHSKDITQLFRKIRTADYVFHEKYWDFISVEAKQVIALMLSIDPKVRITADDALNSPWMTISDTDGSISQNLDSTILGMQKFNARRKLKGVIHAAHYVTTWKNWNSGAVSFMSNETTAVISYSSSKTLAKGKISQKFEDIYSLQTQVRRGIDSTVWKGIEIGTGEVYAIKVVGRNNSAIHDAKVLSEVAILQSLHHQFVVKLHDYFEERPRFLLVMEFMNGGDVFDRIVKNAHYTEKSARSLAHALLTAIEYIHACKIAHRDLKPQNLLLEAFSCNDCIKVADFGFSKRVHKPLSLTTRCGTPTYVAPEILKNHPHDERADMWSVGVIIFVILVGYPPFIEEDQRILFRNIRQGQYEFYSGDWEDISYEAKNMISSLLVLDPAHRFSAKQALQHDWICGMDERTLSNVDLTGSQKEMKKSMSKIYSPDVSEDAPWVACSPLPL